MANIYYKIDGNNCYYTNEDKVGYTQLHSAVKPSNDKYVIIELYNGRLTLPYNCWGEVFRGCLNTKIDNLDKVVVDTSVQKVSLAQMFADCHNLEEVDISSGNITNVTTLEGMFEDCPKLKDVKLPRTAGGSIESFQEMFRYCRSLEYLDLRGFNMPSKESSVYRMFFGCYNLSYIAVDSGTDWQNTGVAGDQEIFVGCTKLPNWDGVTDCSRANDHGGYFGPYTGAWKKADIGLKESGSGSQRTTYMKKNGDMITYLPFIKAG